MSKFKGIITAIVTPFDKDGNIIEGDIKSQLDYLKLNGIDNVFACGSYGAFPIMTTEERKIVAKTVIEHAKKIKMKTIIQIGSPSTKIAIDLANHAESHGADAISSVVPFYYTNTIYNDDTFYQYFYQIINSVSIDVHCYNNAKTTGYKVNPSLLRKLLGIGLKGIKDGSKDMGSMLEMIDTVSNYDFDYYPSSTSSLVTGFLLGVESCISGVSLTIPKTVVSIYEDIQNGKIDDAIKKWKWVMKVRKFLGMYGARAIAAYAVLQKKNVISGDCRSPWIPLDFNRRLTLLRLMETEGVRNK